MRVGQVVSCLVRVCRDGLVPSHLHRRAPLVVGSILAHHPKHRATKPAAAPSMRRICATPASVSCLRSCPSGNVGGWMRLLARVARIGSEKGRKKQNFLVFFAAARRASRESPETRRTVRRSCVAPATSRDRDGGLHREPPPRKSSRCSGSCARRARPGLFCQDGTRTTLGFRNDGGAPPRVVASRNHGLFGGNHGEKSPLRRSPRPSD